MSNATPALTLAHLAPYLPYKLTGYCFWKNDSSLEYERTGELVEIKAVYDPKEVHPLVVKSKSFPESRLYSILAYDYDTFKPILRPMSDLTKQIYHGGRTFIPAKVLWNVSAKQEDLFDIYGTIPDYWKSCMGEHPFSHEYRTVRRLFEWHFDVFGLIDQGLAISYKEAGL